MSLTYFKHLVDLVSLERLSQYYEERLPKEKEVPTIETIPKVATKSTLKLVKRSYEPQLEPKQYKVILICIERIRLFRRPTKVTELKKLFKGKLVEPLQVTNQKTLVYLFDQLGGAKFIKTLGCL